MEHWDALAKQIQEQEQQKIMASVSAKKNIELLNYCYQ